MLSKILFFFNLVLCSVVKNDEKIKTFDANIVNNLAVTNNIIN